MAVPGCVGGEEERIRSAGIETIELLCLEEGEDGKLMRFRNNNYI